jgi:hypothetical protein
VRGCNAGQLACALISAGLEMVDAVLDGDDPARRWPKVGRRGRHVNPGSGRKGQMLAALIGRADAGGIAKVSRPQLAAEIGITIHHVREVLRELSEAGLVEVIERGMGRKTPNVYRVTPAGRAAVKCEVAPG